MEMHSKALNINQAAQWSLKVIIMLTICLFVFYFNVLSVHAEIASGTYDGVDWQITDDGELIIGKEGQTQEFTYQTGRSGSSYPWSTYRTQIKTCRFKGTVKGNGAMGNMFYHCSALTNLDVSGFDTSKVTGMSDMFNGCNTLTSLDVSGFDTSSVTNMNRMFSGCKSLANE